MCFLQDWEMSEWEVVLIGLLLELKETTINTCFVEYYKCSCKLLTFVPGTGPRVGFQQ